ncbi:ADP-ribose pyrophosphatase, mitochondrial isoform X2 [Nematostella vectensis]|nr:ADP-ribose pyrophosphatase, mitochondrial isoform X2 [Nematostella vectensis]
MHHTKARTSVYPGSNLQRFPVPDNLVTWKEPFPNYTPVDYTAPSVLKRPVWADPDTRQETVDPPLLFNKLDKAYNVDRTSYTGMYEIKNNVPLNPFGRTGLEGRGLLGRWGPNHAADPVVTRWKRDNKGNKVLQGGKPVLEFVAIKRKDTGEWAIPGGMVDPGDTVSITLKKEFGEEAMNSMEVSQEEKDKLHAQLTECFKTGHNIYSGYVDDPRNTDNAWMETHAVNYHDESGNTFKQFRLQAGDDAGAVAWTPISHDLNLYASHADIVRQVAEYHHAFF